MQTKPSEPLAEPMAGNEFAQIEAMGAVVKWLVVEHCRQARDPKAAFARFEAFIAEEKAETLRRLGEYSEEGDAGLVAHASEVLHELAELAALIRAFWSAR